MGDAADAELQIKFRHVLGDVGPFNFDDKATIQSVKETIFNKWPAGRQGSLQSAVAVLSWAALTLACCFAEGPLAKETPTSAADLRILCSGQFLDNSKTLKGGATP